MVGNPVSWTHPLISGGRCGPLFWLPLKAVAVAQGTSEDHSGSRESGGALAEGLPPHPRNPRGRCSESFPHRPAKSVLPLCSTHARRPAISSPGPLSLWEQLAGPPGHLRVASGTESGGLGWPATLGPGRRLSGHLLGGGQAGSGFTAHLERQLHAVLCWMPGPVKSQWLTCYLWRPPDSRLILSFWVGHDASASQSTTPPEELINQSQPASMTQGSSILLEASGDGLLCIFLGSLSDALLVELFMGFVIMEFLFKIFLF